MRRSGSTCFDAYIHDPGPPYKMAKASGTVANRDIQFALAGSANLAPDSAPLLCSTFSLSNKYPDFCQRISIVCLSLPLQVVLQILTFSTYSVSVHHSPLSGSYTNYQESRGDMRKAWIPSDGAKAVILTFNVGNNRVSLDDHSLFDVLYQLAGSSLSGYVAVQLNHIEIFPWWEYEAGEAVPPLSS